MFLTVPWGMFIFSKIARCRFLYSSQTLSLAIKVFLISREKLGDYLKWTDYSTTSHLDI